MNSSAPKTIQFFSSLSESTFLPRMLSEFEALGWNSEQVMALYSEERRSSKGPLKNLWHRFRMYPGFGGQVVYNCLKSSHVSCRVVTTNPFFAPWLAAKFSRKDVPVINLVYDLYPDALEVADILSPNSIASRPLRRITKSTFCNCDATVFLGNRLKQYAEERYGPCRYSCVIPVGADGTMYTEKPPKAIPAGQPLRFLYCGNMGKLHDTDTLLRFLNSERFSRIRNETNWLFYANGSSYRKMREQLFQSSSDKVISFGEPLEQKEWTSLMRDAHVAVVTMAPGAENVVMPSKAYSALVAGQAIMAICPEESALADLVNEHDCGWVIEPGDVDRLQSVVEESIHSPNILLEKRNNAYTAGHSFYDMSVIAQQWADLFEEISGG